MSIENVLALPDGFARKGRAQGGQPPKRRPPTAVGKLNPQPPEKRGGFRITRRVVIAGGVVATGAAVLYFLDPGNWIRRDGVTNTAKMDVLNDEPERAYNVRNLGYEKVRVPTTRTVITPSYLTHLYSTLSNEIGDFQARTSAVFSNLVEIAEDRGISGSGVLLDEGGIILTAAHSFQDPQGGASLEPRIAYVTMKTPANEKVKGFPILSVYADFKTDLAVVYAPTGRVDKPTPYLQLRENPPGLDEPFWSVSVRESGQVTILRGVWDIKLTEEAARLKEDQFSLRKIKPVGGSSGGPVLDREGRVIGVLSGALPGKTSSREDYRGANIAPVRNFPELIKNTPFLLKSP